MRTEDTHWKFILIYIEDIIFLNWVVVLGLLAFYFVVSPSALYVAICHDLDWSYAVLQEVVAELEISDEIFIVCADRMHLTVVSHKLRWEGCFALDGRIFGI